MILYTGGSFDCYHSGHVNFLRQCRGIVGNQGRVVVAVNSDEFIRRFKGRDPVMALSDRMAILASVRYVDQVVVNIGDEDSRTTIELVGPDIIAIDTGWYEKDYYAQMGFTQDWLDERGVVLAYLPRKQGISTTQLRERL